MGYMMAMGPCIGCGRVFTFNPLLVPSSSAVTGEREPICEGCVDRLNVIRRKKRMALIVPLPGAYEPRDEDEI